MKANDTLCELEERAKHIAIPRLEARLDRLERRWLWFPYLRAVMLLRKIRKLKG